MSSKMIIARVGKVKLFTEPLKESTLRMNTLAKSFIEATPYMNDILESAFAEDIYQKQMLIYKSQCCGPTSILTRHIEYKTPEMIFKKVPEYILKSANEVKNEKIRK